MSNQSILQNVPSLAPVQPLACRLRPKTYIGRIGPVPYRGEVELENLSTSELQIEHEMTQLQYLNLIIRDTHGDIVSDRRFGDRFSPFEEPQVLRLAPGEKFHADIHLLATMPRGPIAAGTYFVQAVYEYNGFRAESEPVEVTVAKTIE